MFDNEDWNVDRTAVQLDSSLFGRVTLKKHNSRKNTSKSTSELVTDDVALQPNLKRKAENETDSCVHKPKKRRQKKSRGKLSVPGSGDEPDVNPLQIGSFSENIGGKIVLCKVNQKKKKKSKVKAGRMEHIKSENQEDKMVKQNVSIRTYKLGSEQKGQSSNNEGKPMKRKRKETPKLLENSSSNVSSNPKASELRKESSANTTKFEKKKQKRKKDNPSMSEISSAKKTKLDESVSYSESKKETTKMNRKERRNKRKKKNSKKNKYTHLSLASQAERNKVKNDVSSARNENDPNQQKKCPVKVKPTDRTKLPSFTSADLATTPSKPSFNLAKLKEVLSSSEKKIKEITEELEKKSEKQHELKLGKESSKQQSKMKKRGQKEKKGHEDSKVEKGNVTNGEHNMKGKKKESDRRQVVNEGQKSLSERMQEQLNAARFRYINEQLYTTTGVEAAQLFDDDDDAFHVYHKGYQTQVSKWPVDPLNIIIKHIKARHKSPNTVIADMGCGSARLAQSLPGVKVHSFDFVAANDFVSACDMSHVPLEDESVDVVVFCLSLMGTNLVDYILEANRILKTGGIMKIAEVESRFQKVGAFVSKMEKLGFELVTKDLTSRMFYLFDFKKDEDVDSSGATPKIELDPCIYKKR